MQRVKMLQFGLKTILAKKATTGGGEATDNVAQEAEEENREGEGEVEGKGKAQSESD